MSKHPGVGDAMPDIALETPDGGSVKVSDFKGKKLVMFFYPKDDTPGCTIEACEFRDAKSDIDARDAQVWGVSILGTGSKQAFKAKFGLPFTLLADENHEVAERYGTWVEKQNYGRTYMGVKRSTFLVDPEGRIAQVWPTVKPEGHAAQVLEALDMARTERSAASVK